MKAEYASRTSEKAKKILGIIESAPGAEDSYKAFKALSQADRVAKFKKLKNAMEAAAKLARAGRRAIKAIPLAGLFLGGCSAATSESLEEAAEEVVDTAIGEIPVVGTVYDGAIAAYYFVGWLFS